MLKGRWLRSCAALVVFCFSLVVACISPVCAATTSGDPDSFAVYASYSGGPEATYDSKPVVVPFSGSHVFTSMSPSAAVTVRMNLKVPEIEPVTYDRTLVLDIGLQGSPTFSTTSLGAQAVTWYGSSYKAQTLSGGCWSSFDNMVSVKGKQQVIKVTIPALATSFTVSPIPFSVSFTGNGSAVGVASFGGYVVSSGVHDVVDLVASILDQVQQINGNTASALTALNQILLQCQSIQADTSAILGVLQAVQEQLVTLNGKVDNIYTLLKDALADEAGDVDKKSQELGDQIMQRVDSEQYWSDKNTENFEALDMGNWTFGDGVVGALPTVGNLFKSLWDSIGEVTLIFVFPLMLGIALVIVGRISRTAGKGHKQGGGDDG